MDKKYEIKDYDDMTYEEVHALLVEVMQEACASDEAGPYKSPSIDLSFMEEKPEKDVRRKFTVNRFAKVAAILIIVLLGMNVIMLSAGANVSYSERGLLHRIYEGARGIFTDEDETDVVELNETSDVYTITDFSKIDKAKEIWSNIYVPQYIPNDFRFVNLTIKKEISDDYFAYYEYKNGIDEIYIEMTYVSDEGKRISSSNGEIIELSDRIVCVYWDEIHNYYVADVYTEDMTIYLYGEITKDELINIAKYLSKNTYL